MCELTAQKRRKFDNYLGVKTLSHLNACLHDSNGAIVSEDGDVGREASAFPEQPMLDAIHRQPTFLPAVGLTRKKNT
jgi:hypothetical protein